MMAPNIVHKMTILSLLFERTYRVFLPVQNLNKPSGVVQHLLSCIDLCNEESYRESLFHWKFEMQRPQVMQEHPHGCHLQTPWAGVRCVRLSIRNQTLTMQQHVIFPVTPRSSMPWSRNRKSLRNVSGSCKVSAAAWEGYTWTRDDLLLLPAEMKEPPLLSFRISSLHKHCGASKGLASNQLQQQGAGQ